MARPPHHPWPPTGPPLPALARPDLGGIPAVGIVLAATIRESA